MKEQDTTTAISENVDVRMLRAVSHAASASSYPRTYGAGQTATLSRATAAQWRALGWAELVNLGDLTSAELREGAREAFLYLERQRTGAGGSDEQYLRIPARRRAYDQLLAYVDRIDAIEGGGP